MTQGDSQGKHLIFVLSLGGCGTHMLMDCFDEAGFRGVNTRLCEFWTVYTQAQDDPAAPSRARLFPRVSALQAVLGFYKAYNIEPGPDPLDEAVAFRFFAQALEPFGDRVYAAHIYDFIAPERGLAPDGSNPPWGEGRRDAARALFRRAVVAAGYRWHEIGLIRHPIDHYLSTVERSSDRYDAHELMANVKSFLRLAETENAAGRLDALFRYDRLCAGEPAELKALEQAIAAAGVNAGRFGFNGGELAKYLRYPRHEVERLATELAAPMTAFGYSAHFPSPVAAGISRLLSHLRSWRSEMRAYDRVFAGDFAYANAIFRHRTSKLARLYWQANLLMPTRRANYEALYRRFHGTAMPTPRLERPIRRALGLAVVDPAAARPSLDGMPTDLRP